MDTFAVQLISGWKKFQEWLDTEEAKGSAQFRVFIIQKERIKWFVTQMFGKCKNLLISEAVWKTLQHGAVSATIHLTANLAMEKKGGCLSASATVKDW